MPARFKRCTFCHFAFANDATVDLYALFRGEYRSAQQSRLFALSPLSGTKTAVTSAEVEVLAELSPDEWTPELEIVDRGVVPGRLAELAYRGVVISDADDEHLRRLRLRAETLESQQWHPVAALYHFMARGIESREDEETPDYEALEVLSQDNARRFVLEHGPPPDPFYTHSEKTATALPPVEAEGDLYEVLNRRRTTRVFNTRQELPLNDLSVLLREVFGWKGQARISPDILLLHRTSPSGGARHPTEAFVLIQNVEGLAVGLYHYRAHEHALDPIRRLSREETRKMATTFAGGQSYVGNMHAVVILTSQFYRNYWKYRKSIHTYAAVLMDAAHLSQTFYLVATSLGLGAFFSLAVNTPAIEQVLGIDGFDMGVLALCGCGVKAGEGLGELAFEPFHPRQDAVS